ncbi:MAG TPA: hypothetical protein VF263_04740 [Longimicrobiaceae bacterium]
MTRRTVLSVLLLCALSGCWVAGYGRIQPRHVEGAWSFRATGASACGVDSLEVRLRDGDRTWGSFFVAGEARVLGAPGAGPARRLTHGRVSPQSGHFLLVFSDREAPDATDQFELEGEFDEAGGATGRFTRLLPDPDCTVPVAGRMRDR